jgi:hypothetical protein
VNVAEAAPSIFFIFGKFRTIKDQTALSASLTPESLRSGTRRDYVAEFSPSLLSRNLQILRRNNLPRVFTAT